MRDQYIKMIRRGQSWISALLFIIVFIVCWEFTDFNLTDIELSRWGKSGWVGRLWNTAVCTFAISIFINSFLYLKNKKRLKYKTLFYILFALLSFSLFMVGMYNMNWFIIHNLSAGFYFFFYPLTIFLFSYINRKKLSYKDWSYKVALSVSMAIIPMILLSLFKGMAIAEIAHTIIVIIYNIKLSTGE